MKVKIWGVRGSLPSPLTPREIEERVGAAIRLFLERGHRDASQIESFLASLSADQLGGFGGNTPSIEITTPRGHAIIDGGSGIRALGVELMKGPCGQGKGRVDILMTHFHWDHLIGLPFFQPFYVPGNEIHFHAVQPELPNIIATIFQPPYFPVEIARLQASLQFHRLSPREPIQLNDLKVTPYRLDHPDPCWGYRCEQGGKVFSHCVDSETVRFSRAELAEDLPLYQGVDLLLFDAQYGLIESMKREKWGHGSASVGLDLAIREGIRQILFMHHDPSSQDTRVHSVEDETRRYFETQQKQAKRNGEPMPAVEWGFAREGMEIEL